MSIDHILASITGTPLMITPDKLSVIMDVLATRQPLSLQAAPRQAQAPSLPAPANFKKRPTAAPTGSGLAVIPVTGSLVNRAMPGDSGMITYRNLAADLKRTANDSDIGGIIMDIDSNGGMAAGVHRASALIRDIAEQKPVYAFVDTAAYSAAYYLAAACSKIILADTTCGIGSIGTIAVHRDQAAKNEKDGYVYTVVYAGDHKNDYSPHQPLSDALATELQQSVNRHRMMFAQAVADYRGLPIADVLATEAACYTGQAALDAGLADEIMTMDETVQDILQEMTKQNKKLTGGSVMTTKERLETLISNNDDAPAALADLGYVPHDQAAQENLESAVAEAANTAAAEATAHAVSLIEATALAGVDPLMAVQLITDNATMDEAVKTLQAAKATAAAENTINSTITPLSGDGKHPLIAAAEKMAAAA